MPRTTRVLLVAALASSAFVIDSRASVAAGTVPPGFADAAVASFPQPTAVEWLPSDQVVVLEQGGRVRVGPPDGPFATALTIGNICPGGERGLLGFTHDPAFLATGHVYIYYTADAPGFPGGCVNRVSRFTMVGNTIQAGTELILIDNISSVNGNHNGGDLDIGSDGYLYVAVGDAGRDPRGDSGGAGGNDAAQDVSLLNGKILRVTLDGQPAPGNPFTGPGTVACGSRGNTPSTPTTTCQEIYAYGLRNPYRIAFNRNDGSGIFAINDVGQGTREEVNIGAAGANYGWPIREGACPQGASPPCAAPAAGLTDPITDYGRGQGQYITAGAFVPNGLWPAAYDDSYLFADGGSGRMWQMRAGAPVDYGAPFATDVSTISDMTFGFDANGRMVLYYVQSGGGLRKVTPTGAPASNVRSNLRMVPVTPVRAYDTGPAPVGVGGGDVFNGTTRRVDLNPTEAYEAALVNITIAGSRGPGFVRTWGTGALRPATSSVNVDQPGGFVANAAIVPLAADGTFMLESTATSRVIVDVMAFLDETSGAVSEGRFVSLTPARVVDSRIAAGTTLPSGSTNPFTRSGDDITFTAAGQVGVPGNGSASAVVISVGAIAGAPPGGFVGAYPAGGSYSGTSNVNVLAGDVRANMMVVPLGANGRVSLRTLNVADVVVDVLGYVTSSGAPAATAGLYSSIEPIRLVDTRVGVGFGRLAAQTPAAVTVPGSGSVSAVVQNVVATGTSAPGWVAAFPQSANIPEISTINFTGSDQTRSVLAFTSLSVSRGDGFAALVPTDVVVDVTGTFSS